MIRVAKRPQDPWARHIGMGAIPEGAPIVSAAVAAPLTNAEAVALAVAKLAIDGLIPVRQLATAARSVCVTSNAVLDAVTTVNRAGYRPRSNRLPAPIIAAPAPPGASDEAQFHYTPPAPEPEPAAEPVADLTGAQEAEQRKPDTFPDGTRTRRCGRCHETKPIDQYRYVNKGRKKATGARTFAWQSWCTTCWSTYQQERYLSAAREAALASIGLELDGDQLLCVICEKPIHPSEQASDVVLHCHTTCLADSPRRPPKAGAHHAHRPTRTPVE